MTREQDFIHELERYLDDFEGHTPLPESVRDAVRAQLPSTRQRPPFWPARRFPTMSNVLRYSLVAAVAAIAIVSAYLVGRPPEAGNPPLASPTATVATSPTPVPLRLERGASGPRTYLAEFLSEAGIPDPVEFTFDLPSNWTATQPWLVRPSTVEDGSGLLFIHVSGLYSEPCLANSGAPDISVGTTADELAAALTQHPAYDATVIDDVSIGGHPGVRVELALPSDLDYTTCENGEFWVWDGPLLAEGPNRWDLRIFDVGGRTAILLADVTTATPESVDLIDQMVESIQIAP